MITPFEIEPARKGHPIPIIAWRNAERREEYMDLVQERVVCAGSKSLLQPGALFVLFPRLGLTTSPNGNRGSDAVPRCAPTSFHIDGWPRSGFAYKLSVDKGVRPRLLRIFNHS
jgi:hypothetical protein